MNDYYSKALKARDLLLEHRQEIIESLQRYETRLMIEDEFHRVLDLLDNINLQKEYLARKYRKSASSFLPLNQPLYSLFLYVFVPSLVLDTVYYRPPASQRELHQKLFDLLMLKEQGVVLCCLSRRRFVDDCVKACQIVIFTGKYENVQSLMQIIPNNISLIYNGSALNPIVLGEEVDINQATKDAIIARLYNSGQDCMAPACVLVHKNRSKDFLNCLISQLKEIRVGANSEPTTIVGRLISRESIEDFIDFKTKYNDYLIYGGEYDLVNQTISPSIFFFDEIKESIQNIYFAPYFVVMSYSTKSDIRRFLDTDFSALYAGYISFYGCDSNNIVNNAKNVPLVMLKSQTIFTFENGNTEFGGYGIGCNFVYHNGKRNAQPILISREICNICSKL